MTDNFLVKSCFRCIDMEIPDEYHVVSLFPVQNMVDLTPSFTIQKSRKVSETEIVIDYLNVDLHMIGVPSYGYYLVGWCEPIKTLFVRFVAPGDMA